MNNYETLLQTAYENGVTVYENYPFNSDKIKGLYCNKVIAINKHIDNSIEKACILAEEIGHHETSVGTILDIKNSQNLKQELTARLWAFNTQIGLLGIVNCYKHNCTNIHEMAEYLEVTEAFLNEALNCYRAKYGLCTKIDNYIIYFEPSLGVVELLD